ncbi:hypothetical protein L596_013999 [Steinernema carpocapsae]|uniref:Uncharacterized protein n=1 Tax=Steinernema carpocapsae TaxID=34508 RepID=A0A4U5NA32_STECR|nr:hypothetical protein L596_013999 [Steinernema carpocapsae]
MKLIVLLIVISSVYCFKSFRRVKRSKSADDNEKAYYSFLNDLLKEEAEEATEQEMPIGKPKKKKPPSLPYVIPGPYEPLPGRSHNGDYWPVFPFQNAYMAGLEMQPPNASRVGADLNVAIPTWGMFDFSGKMFNQFRETTSKIGYVSHPINMMGLDKDDFVYLMSDPSMAHNRNIQPLLPLAKIPRSEVPLNCRPPLCNPYTQTFDVGVEHDIGGFDGWQGNLDLPIPIGKDLAYRFPMNGHIYYAPDNLTLNYGHQMAPVDPYVNPFMMGNKPFLDGYRAIDNLYKMEEHRKKRSLEQPLEYDIRPLNRRFTMLGTSVRYPHQRIVVPYSSLKKIFYKNPSRVKPVYGTKLAYRPAMFLKAVPQRRPLQYPKYVVY